MSKSVEELLSKHMAPGVLPETEEARFVSLAANKREAVARRLEVLDRYLSIAQPTAADAAAAASKLGMTARNFYRLVARLRELGPVRGLAPGYRSGARRSPANDGLGAVAEQALVALLERSPEARWKDALRVVAEACEAAQIEAPSSAAIRRRLLALRAAGAISSPGPPVFGESWVFDQTALDLPVVSFGVVRYAVVTLVVDRSTRLILGAGVSEDSIVEDSGLFLALASMLRAIPGIAGLSVRIAPRIREVHWTAPEGLEGFAGTFSTGFATAHGPGTVATTSSRGPRRHGDVLLRLIGARLGPYRLLPRYTAEPRIPVEDPLRTPVSSAQAELAVREAVASWNRAIIDKMHREEPSKRSLRQRRRRLVQLGGQLVNLFSSILSAPSLEFLGFLKQSLEH